MAGSKRDSAAAPFEAGEPSGELSEDQIIDRDTRVIAYIPRPLGAEVDAELTFRQTRALVAEQAVVICEVCVTTIDDHGNRVTVCVRIPCPKNLPPKPPIQI